MKKIKLPQIIAHRGCAGYAPENTLEAIHTAADMDIDWVEIDVKITKDQIPILFHDDTLERTSIGTGNIADLTLAELREFEVGSYFSESFSGVRIPTLLEAIDVILERDLGLNLEIKPCPGREKETAEVILDLMSHIWDDHERLLVSSFSHVSLETAYDMVENWHRGFLLEGNEWPDNWQEFIQHLDPSTINIDGNMCDPKRIQDAVNVGLPVIAYTVNDPGQAHLLQSLGVHTIISDEPDVIQDGILTLH